jgi:hypothetical protein
MKETYRKAGLIVGLTESARPSARLFLFLVVTATRCTELIAWQPERRCTRRLHSRCGNYLPP